MFIALMIVLLMTTLAKSLSAIEGLELHVDELLEEQTGKIEKLVAKAVSEIHQEVKKTAKSSTKTAVSADNAESATPVSKKAPVPGEIPARQIPPRALFPVNPHGASDVADEADEDGQTRRNRAQQPALTKAPVALNDKALPMAASKPQIPERARRGAATTVDKSESGRPTRCVVDKQASKRQAGLLKASQRPKRQAASKKYQKYGDDTAAIAPEDESAKGNLSEEKQFEAASTEGSHEAPAMSPDRANQQRPSRGRGSGRGSGLRLAGYMAKKSAITTPSEKVINAVIF